MNNKRIIRHGLAGLAMAALFTACQADMDAPGLETPVATIDANISIAELKTIYQDRTELVGLKDSVTGEHYVIKGRIVSSDASGNIYKNLVVQDGTAALTFSINQGSMYTEYRLGQEVVVDMTNLYMGYYRGLQQVGWPNGSNDGEPQLGFMAYDFWLSHAQKNGLPDTTTELVEMNSQWPENTMYCIGMTLPIESSDLIKKQSQLVELRNVHFVGAGQLTYAPKQETVSRILKNEAGDSIQVRMSGYSNFYNDTLPTGTGTVRGILGYYGDSWQLTIRDISDVNMDDMGTPEKPFSVETALKPQYQGRKGWTAGYIVGSVMPGESATDNANIIFGSSALIDNNLVVGPTPDCTDLSQCIVVDLPQKSQLRRYGNLVDNPDVYKKRISINGEIGHYLGHVGIVNCTGKAGSFEIEGVDVPVPTGEFKEVFHGLEPSALDSGFTYENITLGSGLSYVWSWKSYNGKSYLNGSAYVGSPKEALSYAVSPEIDLSGKLEAKMSFRHAAKFQTTLRQLCGVAVRVAGSDTWTEFTIPTWPEAGTWYFSDSGEIDITEFAGKKIQVAFKYGSSAEGADTWEINDLIVSAR